MLSLTGAHVCQCFANIHSVMEQAMSRSDIKTVSRKKTPIQQNILDSVKEILPSFFKLLASILSLSASVGLRGSLLSDSEYFRETTK